MNQSSERVFRVLHRTYVFSKYHKEYFRVGLYVDNTVLREIRVDGL